jgi:hypothetical protein
VAELYAKHSLSRIHTDWSIKAGESFRLSDPAFRDAALGMAREMMCRARQNVEILVDRLSRFGYRFAVPEAVHVGPDRAACDWIAEREAHGIYLPISVQAWIAEVGSVNLMGSHPSWPKTAYVFEDMPATNDVWYTDPLVVELGREWIDYLHRQWNASVDECGVEQTGPFLIDFAPDHIHKANVSGGPPLQVAGNYPSVESLVFNETHCVGFMAYVRLAMHWGGLPGFEDIPEAPREFIERLKEGLLPL